ncbi:peptidase S53 propeptide [Linnemannia elongata]|nr:peptidase S53 propeptide [Linnemannia elongata]
MNYVAIPGSGRTLLPNSRPAGPVDLSQVAAITVRVRSGGDIAALEKEVNDQSKQKLEDRTYLTVEQLTRQYGAHAEDLDLVEQYAQKHNLVITKRCPAERSIVLQGKLRDLLNAFPTSVRMYHHSTGTYRGRQGEIGVPQDLKDVVTGIFGFDTRPMHRRGYRRQRAITTHDDLGPTKGVVATEYAKRYSFPTEFNGVNLDGTGQTIAIIELGGGFRQTDLETYFKDVDIPLPTVISVAVGADNNPIGKVNSADGEVMLDIEVAGAVAPKAKIVVYFAPNTNKGFQDAIRAAIYDEQRKPSVISISWGTSEDYLSKRALRAFHHVFLDAARMGITICVASGDHGTANAPLEDWDRHLHVDHPSSDPYVLSCGGTQIGKHGDVVWNEVFGGDCWTSGSGISRSYPVPFYQSKANLPVSIANSRAGRGVPDIAMSATNYYVRVDSTEMTTSGTSAVAPLMAALVARLNQAKGKRVGFLNPFLYARAPPDIVCDVTIGNNGHPDGDYGGYQAARGWDACTGLGTPNGSVILSNL